VGGGKWCCCWNGGVLPGRIGSDLVGLAAFLPWLGGQRNDPMTEEPGSDPSRPMPTALLKAGGLGLKRVGFRGDCLLQPLCFEHALLLPRKPLCFRLLHKGSWGRKTGPVRDTGLEELVAAGYQLLIGMGVASAAGPTYLSPRRHRTSGSARASRALGQAAAPLDVALGLPASLTSGRRAPRGNKKARLWPAGLERSGLPQGCLRTDLSRTSGRSEACPRLRRGTLSSPG
jgi:hypothetical protein